MNQAKNLLWISGLTLMVVGALPAQVASQQADAPIQWDAKLKEYTAREGEPEAPFTFALKNTTAREIVITGVRTSCGCTVAELPSKPWHLAPGEGGEISVSVDLRGKYGTITKSVFVDTSIGMQPLTVRAIVPGNPSVQERPRTQLTDRQRNQLLALRDNQAIFKNDCASCHVTPGIGKMDKELYDVSCGICHDSHNRASVVPDLKKLEHATGREFWEQWIRHGKEGSMMPAFASDHGGPLTDAQVKSLVDFLTETITQKEERNGPASEFVIPLFPDENTPIVPNPDAPVRN